MKQCSTLAAMLFTALLHAQGPMQQGDGIWLRNAFFGEAQTFDACGGHQPGNGQYHHHAVPNCLREQLNDNIERIRSSRTGPVYREKRAPWTHSPILGWAFDGHPIYGPYAYSDPRDPRSSVRRMRSGYRLRTITDRTTLPDWAMPLHANTPQQLGAAQYGPPVNARFPLGRYLEDYEHAAGAGDLDVHNGRFAVTPEFPQGVYAYHVTIEENGTPAFPYILAAQFYGAVNGGNANTVPGDAVETPQSDVPQIASWATKNAQQAATVVGGFNPAGAPQTTWPVDAPAGTRTSGGVTAAANADVQRVRHNASAVYVNANGLASYTMGPWFDALQPGGVFGNFPSVQRVQAQIPRTPTETSTRRSTGLGAQGLWVNGVAVFNTLDGASYSNTRGSDVGGGLVALAAAHVSAASFEPGPLAPGSLVAAFPLFGLSFTAPESTLVTVRDSAGVERSASISYASADQINYRLPEDTAIGFGAVNISGGGVTLTGNINVREAYPNLFQLGSVTRIRGGQQSNEPLTQPIDLGPAGDQVYLVLYGSGLGRNTTATATIGGVNAEVSYAGAQGQYAGLDQYNVLIPRSLSGRGLVNVVVSAGGRASNTLPVEIR